MEDDVEQEVTEFLPEVGIVLAVDGLEQLADFLDEAVANRQVRLLAIPRATIGGTEPGGGCEKEVDARHALMERVLAGESKRLPDGSVSFPLWGWTN
jgi:hypothetical protein